MASKQEQELTELQSSITSIVKPVLAGAGLANPVTASALFGIDLVFRFVSLGAKIRTAIEEQRLQLDAAVRADGILRVPITVDTTADDVLTFFVHDPDFADKHPLLASQFEPEIETLQHPDRDEYPRALKVLDVARHFLPRLERELVKRRPVRDPVFETWIDPGNPDLRTLAYDYVALGDRDALSLEDHLASIPEYLRMRFRAAGVRLDQEAERAAQEAARAIAGLMRETLLGDKGAIKAAMKFGVDRRIELIDAEREQLCKDKAAIESMPDANRSPQARQRLGQISERLAALTELKSRLNSSVGS